MKLMNFTRAVAFGICGVTATVAHAADISGAGATFPYPIYAKWADMYKKETGLGLNYQSIGSGGGIKQIKAKTVTFGASDMPLEPKDVTASGLVQFPTVVGGDVPVVNLDGVGPGELVLDGPTLANIFLGEDHQVGRSGDREAEPERQTSVERDRRRASLGRFGHDIHLHELPVQGQRRLEIQGRRRARRSNGRSASAPRATRASPTTWLRRRAPSATWNTPTPCRTR